MRTIEGKPVGVNSLGQDVYYRWIAGLSTEDKPTENIATGSIFHEVDTTKIYAFNEAGAAGSQWVEQMTLSGE